MGVLAGTSSMRRGAISGRPLPERTNFGVCNSTDPPMPLPPALWPSPYMVV